ncbi:hypothetical protein MKX03_035039 [Papaver bracteatum]|nr:hypothetical protein MKX03_035039 [Papaver bracteatum]
MSIHNQANQTFQQSALPIVKPMVSYMDIERPQTIKENQADNFDYSQRAQWLRAAVLGANDGLVSTASLMMGVGAVKEDVKFMILTELAQIKRYNIDVAKNNTEETESAKKEYLPNPFQAAGASAVAFSLGAMVPLLAASFIKGHKVRLGAVTGATSLALLVFGGLGAVLGKAPLLKSSLRVLVGGWIAMAITFGLTKLIGTSGL